MRRSFLFRLSFLVWAILGLFAFACTQEQPPQCQAFLDCAQDSDLYSSDDKALFEEYYGVDGRCWSDWDLVEFCEERCGDFVDHCSNSGATADENNDEN